ncbi:MAG: S-formylglutathione hydrolase [Spongiibacteraceae bacterium]
MSLELKSTSKCFDGWQQRWKHQSTSLNCEMVVSIYLPPQALTQKVPVLYWLSGLTCNDQNFVTKAGAQEYAAKHGVAIVAPDTSPRGEGVANADGWDLGQGAGFYVDATQAPWSAHFRMYSYIVDELPELIAESFSVDPQRAGIFGHSMGGHGALTIALRNPEKFRSVSAFAPICAPTLCPWGQKAFTAYFGEDRALWAQHDSAALLATTKLAGPILIDQGMGDEFLAEQLLPEQLERAAAQSGQVLALRRHADYDHSYFFIASFIADHIDFHARALG